MKKAGHIKVTILTLSLALTLLTSLETLDYALNALIVVLFKSYSLLLFSLQKYEKLFFLGFLLTSSVEMLNLWKRKDNS
jgi:hypothetical protein